MRIAFVTLAVAASGVPLAQVGAEEIGLKPLADARLRYEHVDQDGLRDHASAITARVRSGVQATRGRLSALVEAEATLAIVDRYNDGTNGFVTRPLVVDPQNVELNRAQLRYAVAGGPTLTAGRQLVELADQRFVGSASFRQNQQTFDAVRGQWTPAGFAIDLTYARSARTVNGVNGRGARPTAIRGDNVFALVGHATPLGMLTGYAYLVDQDSAAVQRFALSSQTYGARLAGTRPLGAAKLAYAASYARQRDYHRNPNDYAADYYLGEATVSLRGAALTGGYEVLGASRRGLPLTSVQTPLASLFKFQGWADRFTTTPADGVRDAYGTIAYGWTPRGTATAVSLSATYHRFDSDRLSRHDGDEVDLLASAKRGRYTASVRLAHYDADRFATDTDKLWLSLDWAL